MVYLGEEGAIIPCEQKVTREASASSAQAKERNIVEAGTQCSHGSSSGEKMDIGENEPTFLKNGMINSVAT